MFNPFGILAALDIFALFAPRGSGQPSPRKQPGGRIELRGGNGKTMLAEGGTIKIVTRGGVFVSQSEKVFPIRHISAVKVKKPGVLTSGLIQLFIAGSDEDTWVIIPDAAAYQAALQIKNYIEQY